MRYFYILCTIILFWNCDSFSSSDPGNCDQSVDINATKYANEISDSYTINEVNISGDCLVINYSGSGCDGNSWKLDLIDSGAVAESEPPQRSIRFLLEDKEDCEAYITKEISFNISDLKDDDASYILNIQDYDSTILYE